MRIEISFFIFNKLTYRLPILDLILPPVLVVVGVVRIEGGSGGGLVPADRSIVGSNPLLRHGRSDSLRALEKKESLKN